jgi:ABC-type glycerol-3-phosphate transport system substrate-binding protein
MDEFMAVLRDNPRADMPMGMGFTRESFLMYAVMMSMDEYVDWATGVCYFDRGGFAQLLEFCNTLPGVFDWDREEWFDQGDLIAQGRQIMQITGVQDFSSVQMSMAYFGSDIVFKGFPTESRNGNSLTAGAGIAMTTRCSDKEGAWDFMRTILTEEWQRANVSWSFPTNKAVFNSMLEEAMTQEYYTDEDGNEVPIPKFSIGISRPIPAMSVGTSVGRSVSVTGSDSGMLDIFALTQEEADKILALIESSTGTSSYNESLMTIINEGAADFFSGRSSAQDAARIIQSRASILVAEQS